MKDDFLTTETKLTEMINKVVDKVKPTECNLHAQLIKEFQEDINGLCREVGNIRTCQKERDKKTDEIMELLNGINKRLFISNGEICIAEEQRNLRGKIDRHITNHDKIQVSGKLIASVIGSILLGVVSLAFNFVNSEKKHEVSQSQVKDVLKQIIQEQLK